MRIARPLGLSPDGAVLVVATDEGDLVGIPADERLVAALRRDRPRMGQLEIEMDSGLTPREIQDRIRAGRSLDEVAREAGAPVEKVEPFAVPVLAERAHLASAAQTSSVRRRGETHGHRTLRHVVQERLMSRGIDPDTVEWDAWRNEDRRWTVKAAYRSGTAQREALFLFDKGARFSTSVNDDARWLLSEPGPSTGPQPGRRGHRFDDSDELALVRAVSDDQEGDEVAPEDAAENRSATPAGSVGDQVTSSDSEAVDDEPEDSTAPRSGVSPQEIGEQVEAELDAFDVIPEGQSEMDVLYDMLGGINEDSINIYAGLDQPVTERDEEPTQDEEPSSSRPQAALLGERDPSERQRDEEPTERTPTEPEQPSLVDEDVEAAQPAPTKTRRPKKKARASVPSWDEIMFGGPPPKP